MLSKITSYLKSPLALLVISGIAVEIFYLLFFKKQIEPQRITVAQVLHRENPSASKNKNNSTPSFIYNKDRMELAVDERATIEIYNSGYQIQFQGPSSLFFQLTNSQNSSSPVVVFLETNQPIKIIQTGQPSHLFIQYEGQQWPPEKLNSQMSLIAALKISPSPTQISPSKQNLQTVPNTESPSPSSKDQNNKLTLNERILLQVQNRQSEIKRCHLNRFQQVGLLQGQITLGVRIAPNGEALNVQTLSSDIDDQKLQHCLHSLFKRIRFPEFKSNESILRSFPIIFE